MIYKKLILTLKLANSSWVKAVIKEWLPTARIKFLLIISGQAAYPVHCVLTFVADRSLFPLQIYKYSTIVMFTCTNFIIDIVPKMKHLNQYVIPKIAAHWKKVADSLEFRIHTIRIIEKKFHQDPLESCDEMMRYWLSTDVGIKPKVWSTLIAAIKDVKQLTAVVEEIEQDVKRIS